MSLKKNYLEMETYLKTNNKHTIVKKKKIKNAGSKRKIDKMQNFRSFEFKNHKTLYIV